MLAEIKAFVKDHIDDIMLFVIVTLLVLLAFAVGFITARYQFKEPIQVENVKR